ncbi:hypothetical protein DAI22_03g290400 [Oryza sativa Japonica Group]|nr:hypothetical protein DAI22_03g290400 [Oryza sativa Japonica Group]
MLYLSAFGAADSPAWATCLLLALTPHSCMLGGINLKLYTNFPINGDLVMSDMFVAFAIESLKFSEIGVYYEFRD